MVAEVQDEAATWVNAVCASIAMFERVKLLFLSQGNCVSTFISLIPLGIFKETWGHFQMCMW